MWFKNKNHVFPDVRTNKRERSLRPFELTATAHCPSGSDLFCCLEPHHLNHGVSLTSIG